VVGARALEAKVAGYEPRFVAVLGVGAYRTGFGRRHAKVGRQPERLARSGLWVLPNRS
jgi:TDG/mug DNA glycosylase family protein